MISRRQIRLINLARQPGRLERFRQRNENVPLRLERFEAIDGETFNLAALRRGGMIGKDVFEYYTRGQLGCSISHLTLWREIAESYEPTTICEDDAVFHSAFEELSRAVMADVPDFDIVLWGWNFDAGLLIELIPDLAKAVLFCDQDELRRVRDDEWQIANIDPRPFRLMQAFGTVCYTVSPAGARKLYDEIVPLRPLTIELAGSGPGLRAGRQLPHVGIDVAMSAAYPSLAAYVCVPPLVITPNEKG